MDEFYSSALALAYAKHCEQKEKDSKMEKSEKMAYDYKKSKKDVIAELTQPTKITNVKSPTVSDLTFENGKRAWVSACFVDIRNSSGLFKGNAEKEDEKVARLMRAFSGEIIKIMRDENYIHIGLQGDCVYGVFSTPQKSDINNVFSMAARINTFIKMLNKLLEQNSFQTIKVGIGLSCGNDLIIKAGADYTGISDILFIGNAVADASHNSSKANKTIHYDIVASSIFHGNLNEHNSGLMTNVDYSIYGSSAIIGNMNDWISEGMNT